MQLSNDNVDIMVGDIQYAQLWQVWELWRKIPRQVIIIQKPTFTYPQWPVNNIQYESIIKGIK